MVTAAMKLKDAYSLEGKLPLNLHATTVFFTTINFLTCKTKHNPNEKKKNLIINHLTESIGIL